MSVRDLLDRCVAASVAFFFKQWGGVRPKSGGRELDGQEWSEYPEARGWQDKSRKVRPVDPPAFSTTRETL